MAATAKLLEAIKTGEGWKIKVEYTDGADKRIATHRMSGTTNNDLITFIRNQATKFTEVKASDYSEHIGKSIDITIPEPTPIPAPTAAEIAKAAWFADWRQLQQLQSVTSAVPALATSAAIALETSLKTSLEAGWLNSYLGDI